MDLYSTPNIIPNDTVCSIHFSVDSFPTIIASKGSGREWSGKSMGLRLYGIAVVAIYTATTT